MIATCTDAGQIRTGLMLAMTCGDSGKPPALLTIVPGYFSIYWFGIPYSENNLIKRYLVFYDKQGSVSINEEILLKTTTTGLGDFYSRHGCPPR